MIFLLLIITKVVADTEADFYAVQFHENYDYYVFTRVGNCSVYKSQSRGGTYGSLFFQDDEIWKIGKLKKFDEIDCKNISSFVDSKSYRPFREAFIKIFLIKKLKCCIECGK